MRLFTLTIITACIMGLSITSSLAEKKQGAKELYKQNCKICHDKKSPSGEYTPMTLIMDQWERFFEKKYEKSHKDVKHPVQKDKAVIEVITKDMLKKIKKFCIDHAADSEQPMTCG